MSPPYAIVPRGAPDEELGAAVMRAIEAFTLLADDWSDEEVRAARAELLAFVGVKNATTFERGASLVHVNERKRQWTVEPWDRVRGGWLPLAEGLTSKLSSPSAAEIGGAVRQAFVTLRGRP